MPTSYTSLLGLALPVTGELSGTWGDTVNQYITQYVDAAVAGAQTISGSQTAVTLSVTNGSSLSQAGAGATGSAQYQIINCTGNPASALTVTVPSASKVYLVLNNTSTNQTVTVKGAATTGVTVAAARCALIAWNGTDYELVATDDASKMNGVLAAVNGGTGQSSYAVGDILYASTTTALSKLADVATGNALISGGVGVAPSYGKIGLTTHVSGTLPVANGGTNGTATPTAGTIAYGTGSAYAFNTAGTSGQPLLSGGAGAPTFGTLSVGAGGTGQTSYTDGQLLIGNTATTSLSKATLTAGSGVSITNGNGSITISATGSGGTVTSVGATSPVASSGGNTPTISLSAAYGDTLNPYASKTANFFLAAPNGAAGVPTFRAIVAADIPTLNQNTTGTASNVTGTVAVANGGTGATTAPNARTNLGATTVGSNFFTLTNPSAITFPRINADNTVSALDAATFRTAIGAGTGGGSVTSVSGTGTVSGISLSGTVTTSGSLTLGGTLDLSAPPAIGGTTPNTGAFTSVTSTSAAGVLTRAAATQDGVEMIGRAGGTLSYKVSLTPTTLTASRTLTLPDNSGTVLTTGATVTVAQGGTGATTLTGVVKGNGTSAFTAGTVSLTSEVAGTLPVGNGGTGTATAFTAGSVVFAGASGVYSQNNTNFFWDNTTSSLGIGTSTPVGKLHLNVSSGAIYYRISSGLNAMLMGGLAGASGEVSSNGDLVFGAGTSFAERGRYSSDGTFRVKGAGTAGSTDAFQVSGSAPASAVSLNSAGNFLVGGTAARATTAGSASIQLFNGTAPAGTLTNGVSLYSSSGDLNFMDSAGNGFKVGYRNLPPVGTKTASYTLATGDVGKYVQLSTGGAIVIPTSTFAEGDAITLFNNTTGNITITCSAPTAYIAGTNTVKTSMTLATRGVATILFISSTLCVVTGNVT